MTGKNATCPGSGWSTEMPSNRYSFVRGRPPLMRGSCEAGGKATPGASDASVMNVRPLSGRPTIFSADTTSPRLGVDVRSIDASPVTVTVSLTAPKPSAKSTLTLAPVATRTPWRTAVLNPVNSTRMSYTLGAMPVTAYTPAVVVTAVRAILRSTSVAVIVAPGTTAPA